ncbi:MAG: phenazine-specific anthranilate synthase component I [Propionibacteriales bacterium]|nr:phenazine-specific anthranilate synthase component I [Propionibacteriales bacterium]
MSALDDLLTYPAYALIRLRGSGTVTLLGGTREDLEWLADVPLEDGPLPAGRRFDRLLCVPFRQVGERGFEVHDDGTPLSAIAVDYEREVPLAEVMRLLPTDPVQVTDAGGFETDDEEYARIVEAIIRDEIGNGEGANLVIGRNYRARLADWNARKALSVFRRLLDRERGAYWTFCVFTGDRWLIGASPERHVSVHGGDVRMNPISGTFRLRGLTDPEVRRERMLEFLADEKEIYELFMVVDEELKMMCDICSEGGQVLGPYLKPMTHLIHTEYLLAGRSNRDVRDVLRDSMFAATVTGSPVENACRLIKRYETEGRGYYAAVLALLGRDADGQPTADAPILIRTADIGLDGSLKITAGATLVRDSDPEYEVAETHAKAGGILSAFGLVDAPEPSALEGLRDLIVDEDVLIALGSRNQRLSRFWMTDQSGAGVVPELAGRTAVILDGEDDFVNMLRHVLTVMGMKVSVVRHDAYQPGDLDGSDLVIVGPGPGDPRDPADPKMALLREAVRGLLDDDRPFLAVCLGHQVLCGQLGIPLYYKDIVFQGTQTQLEVLGRAENVGFYNTFVARVDGDSELPPGVTVDRDPATGDIQAIAGPHFRGIQFHSESILSENGYGILRDLVTELLR